MESSRLPLSLPHQQMYEVAAEAERTAGSAGLLAWPTTPWRPLVPLERAGDGATTALSMALMRGERRAVALNLRNSSTSSSTVRIQIRTPGLSASALQIYRVNWTGNDLSSWAAAELELLGDASAARETVLLPGVTQQIWIEVSPGAASAAGMFAGCLALRSDTGTIDMPLEITLFETLFPQAPSMHLAGWDWADGEDDERYGVTAANTAAYIEYLRSRYVDMPWAHRIVDAARHPPPLKVKRRCAHGWPRGRRQAIPVFLHTSTGFGDLAPTDEGFAPAVQAWVRAWAEEIRRNGKQPEQFDLLLLDEPQTDEKARTTELWARAIRESGAGMKIWTDPIWSIPGRRLQPGRGCGHGCDQPRRR